MIYSKMWLVVKPSVGSPAFASAAAISSVTAQLAFAFNTGWVNGFLNGGAKVAKTAPAGAAVKK